MPRTPPALALDAEAPIDPPGPRTAAASVLSRQLERLGRSALIFAALCTAIAAFLTIVDGHFWIKMVYSFAIGSSCWLLIDGGRLMIAAGADGWRRLRGQPPSTSGADPGWVAQVGLVMMALVIGPTIGAAAADLLFGVRSQVALWNLDQRGSRFTIGVTLLGTSVAMIVMSTLERLSAARARTEAAQRAATEAQLRLLQSQLEPHMLFNTLANLRALIALDPPRAQAMLDRLVAFLRATLQASRSDRHALAEEFARVRDYLALIEVRMGDRLRTAVDLPPALATAQVPPLLLQPLVENAVLHGLEPRREGGRIEVSARSDGARLVLTVRDTGIGLEAARPSTGTGFGLQQVRERMATLYGDRATLDVAAADDGDGGCRATLTLPLQTTSDP